VLPELEGSSERVAEAPQFFVPDKASVLQHHQLDVISDVLPQEVNSLDDLRATISNPRHIDHLDALLQMLKITALGERRSL
jgi:hypothetical protein